MKISLCICAYNAEKTIGRTIESVLAQTYPDLEIVVVNDGSTDSTLAIVENYARENPGKFLWASTGKFQSAPRFWKKSERMTFRTGIIWTMPKTF